MFRFSRWCYEEHPTLIASLIGNSILKSTCQTLNILECVEPPTILERTLILDEISRFNITECFTKSLAFERATMHQASELFLAGQVRSVDIGQYKIILLYNFALTYCLNQDVQDSRMNRICLIDRYVYI